MRRSSASWLLVIGFAIVLSACGGGNTPAARPTNAPADDTKWFTHPAPNGARVVVGVARPARVSGSTPGVLLVPGTDGLNTDYDAFAHELTRFGFDVAIGCWFADVPSSPTSPVIGCAGAPKFKGVTDAAVDDLGALVAAAKQGLQTDNLTLVGFSRGGGIALLRASTGASEPVVSVSGMVEGRSNLGVFPGEVNVVSRAGGIDAPVLLLHGEADPVVPVQQARDMEAALRNRHVDVQAKYYPGAGHGLAVDPTIRPDVLEQIHHFVCEHATCPAPAKAA